MMIHIATISNTFFLKTFYPKQVKHFNRDSLTQSSIYQPRTDLVLLLFLTDFRAPLKGLPSIASFILKPLERNHFLKWEGISKPIRRITTKVRLKDSEPKTELTGRNPGFRLAEKTDDLSVGKTLLYGDVLMWIMKKLLTSGCTNQRGAGQRKPTTQFAANIFSIGLSRLYEQRIRESLVSAIKNCLRGLRENFF